MHQAVKVAQDTTNGLGLVASEEIPKGSDLIALPHHIPLRFATLESNGGDGLHSALVNLASQVPGTCFHYTLVAIFDSWLTFFYFYGYGMLSEIFLVNGCCANFHCSFKFICEIWLLVSVMFRSVVR